MRHQQIVDCCTSFGLTVRRDSGNVARNYSATSRTRPGVRVYWSTSTEGELLGSARVMLASGRDTHARNLETIRYLLTEVSE